MDTGSAGGQRSYWYDRNLTYEQDSLTFVETDLGSANSTLTYQAASTDNVQFTKLVMNFTTRTSAAAADRITILIQRSTGGGSTTVDTIEIQPTTDLNRRIYSYDITHYVSASEYLVLYADGSLADTTAQMEMSISGHKYDA